jgi:hypothetical protein
MALAMNILAQRAALMALAMNILAQRGACRVRA